MSDELVIGVLGGSGLYEIEGLQGARRDEDLVRVSGH